MILYYSPEGKDVKMADLFDGRLAKYGIREELRDGTRGDMKTDRENRLLHEDDGEWLWCIAAPGDDVVNQFWNRGGGGWIFDAIVHEFGCDIDAGAYKTWYKPEGRIPLADLIDGRLESHGVTAALDEDGGHVLLGPQGYLVLIADEAGWVERAGSFTDYDQNAWPDEILAAIESIGYKLVKWREICVGVPSAKRDANRTTMSVPG
jgi:hypothetical protein